MTRAAYARLAGFMFLFYIATAMAAITRDYDSDLAVLALSCRVSEGVISAIPTIAMVGLLSVATGAAGATAADAAAANALGALLLKVDAWSTKVGATVFAVGSTLYSYLFLRARSIPVPLAWLGLFASVVLVFALPAALAGFMKGALVWPIWLPMLVFEVALGLWLLIKGVAAPQTTRLNFVTTEN